MCRFPLHMTTGWQHLKNWFDINYVYNASSRFPGNKFGNTRDRLQADTDRNVVKTKLDQNSWPASADVPRATVTLFHKQLHKLHRTITMYICSATCIYFDKRDRQLVDKLHRWPKQSIFVAHLINMLNMANLNVIVSSPWQAYFVDKDTRWARSSGYIECWKGVANFAPQWTFISVKG